VNGEKNTSGNWLKQTHPSAWKGWSSFVATLLVKEVNQLEESLEHLFEECFQIDPEHLHASLSQQSLSERDSGLVLALHGQRPCFFRILFEGAIPFPSPVNISFGEEGLSLSKVASSARKNLSAKRVLSIDRKSLEGLFSFLLSHQPPFLLDDYQRFYRECIRLIKGLNERWAITPLLFFLRKGVWRLFVGSPFSLSRLDDQFLPVILTEGLSLYYGHHHCHAVVVLDGSTVLGIFVLEFSNGGPWKITTLPVSVVGSVFEEVQDGKDDLEEGLKEAKFRIWQAGYWVSYAYLVRWGFLQALGQVFIPFLSQGRPLSLWYRFRALFHLRRAVKEGAISLYPDLVIRQLLQWARKEGRWSILYRLAEIPFRKRKPRTRGVLYVKETVVTVVIVIIICLAVLALY